MAEKFNHALLLLARQYRRMSQNEVSDESGLNQGHYSRIENGLIDNVSMETANRIAAALKFPVRFFFQDEPLSGLPISVHAMYRKKKSIRARELQYIGAELNLRLLHMRRLLRSVDFDPELELPQLDVDEDGCPQDIARIVRRAWSVPDGPVHNLTDYCERAGIVVVACKFSAPIDGVTMIIRELPPAIFLNSSVPADRMRFSLAHELGHIIMHRIPTKEMEDEANEFGSEFLMPEREFRRRAIGHRINLQWLAMQKPYWRTSMASILYRLGSVGVLKSHQSEYLWKQFSARGWRRREPVETDISPENPTILPRLVRVHCDQLGYGVEGLQELLVSGKADVWNLYGELLAPGGAGGLRIVG